MARILLVEPNRLLAETYGQALQAAGHDVMWSDRAQDAILAADGAMPDVVVLELQLAGHSGAEFLYEFRSYGEWQQVPVVILSQIRREDSGMTPAAMEGFYIKRYLYKAETSLDKLVSVVNATLVPV